MPSLSHRIHPTICDSVTYLNPASAPFETVVQQRRGSYPAPANSSSGFAYNDQTFYDGFGRPIQTRSVWHWVEGHPTNSREIISSTAYNALGQVSCQTAPYDVAFYSDRGLVWPASPFVTTPCTSLANTRTTYDTLGRPLTVTAPDNSQTLYSYKVKNDITINSQSKLFMTQTFDSNNHVINQLYDPWQRLIQVREYTGSGMTGDPYVDYAFTTYTYNHLDNLMTVTDAQNNITSMTYDNFGRKLTMTDPDMGTWSYTYDAASNLVEQVDAKSQRLCFTYDALNRLQYKRHDSTGNGCETGDTQLAYYAYYSSGTGKVGQLSEIRWSSSATNNRETFDYDTLGRPISQTRIIDSRSYTMGYSSFDAFHRPTTITYPNGQTAVIGYDREGENSLANSGTSLISDIRYNGRGQMTYLDRTTGGIDTAYLYHPQTDAAGGGTGDSNFRLKTIQHGAAGTGNAWPDFTYEYDTVGNITKMTTLSTAGTDTQTFGYDDLNRLVSASASGVAPTYSDAYVYNQIGNITSFDGLAYTYSASHIHAVATANGVAYTYDNNGNMTLRDASGTVNDYSQVFNVENELESVTNNGSTTSFAYDAAGIRVKTTAPNGTITDYPFPGYEVENPTGTPTVRITFSIAGQAVALKVMGSSASTYYLYNDHLGSTATMSTTGGGTVTGSTARYTPFGDWRTEPTANLTDRGFTGHMHNNLGSAPDDIGLIYMNARWYAPTLGRFISADTIVPNPMNPQSLNRYSYVRNSPLNFSDPTGHRECGEDCNSPLPRTSPIVEKLWIPEDEITAIQWYGNTEFAHSLGDGWDYDYDPPNYGYSQGFHGGLDLFAEAGTRVRAGVSGVITAIIKADAWRPQYIEIEVAPGIIVRIGHLAADSAPIKLGDFVTPDTIVGTVSATQNHIHVEFHIDVPGTYHDKLQNPTHFMPETMKMTLIQISIDPATENYAGTHFYKRTDDLWVTQGGQPTIIEYGLNLNVGQGNYSVPDSWD